MLLPINMWPGTTGKDYQTDLVRNKMPEYGKIKVHQLIDALKERGTISDDVAKRWRGQELNTHTPGPLYEGKTNTDERQAILAAYAHAQLQDQEMRGRAWRDAANLAVWSLLAGGGYGLLRNWKKLLVEKDLEKTGSFEKDALVLPTAKSPSDAKMLMYPGDSSFIWPALGIGGAVAGYELVDWLTDRARKAQLEKKRQEAMDEFQTLFHQGISGQRPKLAAALDEAATAAGQEKAAAFQQAREFVGNLDPAIQSVLFSTPLALGTVAFLAARARAIKEKEDESKAETRALRALQARRPTQLQLLAGDPLYAGTPRLQGVGGSRYDVSVPIPAQVKEKGTPSEEFDLTKMSQWEPPTNTDIPMASEFGPRIGAGNTNQIGGLPYDRPYTPGDNYAGGNQDLMRSAVSAPPSAGTMASTPPGTPGSPAAQTPGSAQLPQGNIADRAVGWASSKVEGLKNFGRQTWGDVKDWGAGQLSEFAQRPEVRQSLTNLVMTDGQIRPEYQQAINQGVTDLLMQDGQIKPEYREALTGLVIGGDGKIRPELQTAINQGLADIAGDQGIQDELSGYLAEKFPGLMQAEKFLSQTQQGTPQNAAQWLMGSMMGNPNTQGWGPFWQFLAMLLPGSQQWWGNAVNQAGTQGMQAIQKFMDLTKGWKQPTPAQPAVAAQAGGGTPEGTTQA